MYVTAVAATKRPHQRAADEARAAARVARRKREQRRRVVAAVAAVGVVALGVTILTSGGSKGKTVVTEPTTTSTPGRKPITLRAVPAGAAVTGDTPCPKADGSSARTTSFAKPPPICITPARSYQAEIRTTKGVITVALDSAAAPQTVNNFVVLARYHFYDGIPFHRVIPGFVIQAGDPDATGGGNPGYRFADELPAPGQYKVGSLAMANSGPNTNGSQFFIVTGPQGVGLDPKFALFGQVTGGLEVALAIEQIGIPAVTGDPNAGKPTELVLIDSVTIKET